MKISFKKIVPTRHYKTLNRFEEFSFTSIQKGIFTFRIGEQSLLKMAVTTKDEFLTST